MREPAFSIQRSRAEQGVSVMTIRRDVCGSENANVFTTARVTEESFALMQRSEKACRGDTLGSQHRHLNQ